jgi:phosphomannomutase
MNDLVTRARSWIEGDPDPATRAELQSLIDKSDVSELESRMDTVLSFGTAGLRGEVGAGPGRMNRAVVIRTTYGLAHYVGSTDKPVIVGFDARPMSRQFAEDAAGVLAGAGLQVLYFPDVTPTPLVAFTAKHLGAAAAIVVTASHNPRADNGYKVYGADATQIASPVDEIIQRAIGEAAPANEIPRLSDVFFGTTSLVQPVPETILDSYWSEVSAMRSRTTGSDLKMVYTPIHGCGRDTLFEVMSRAGHNELLAVAEQAEPDGTFPTVSFPNPEEPGALDLALDLARRVDADGLIANDPDADRLAAVVPDRGGWRPLSGNEVGVLLADYLLSHDPDPGTAIVASSIVSSPMLGPLAASYGATRAVTLTGFKWIVKAGRTLEAEGKGRFIFGYEEALGYTVGSVVRDKDGISAALIFMDLMADLDDDGRSIVDRLHALWQEHGLWVSAQTSIVRPGLEGVRSLRDAVERLADDPPDSVGGHQVTAITDYRKDADQRPPWLGAQALVELTLGETGRILIRPSGTEPKLKVYVDLSEPRGPAVDEQHRVLTARASGLGEEIAGSLVV